MLLNTGTKGRAVGQLDIQWSNDKAVPDYEFQTVSLSDRLPDSPRMIELLMLYQQMLTAENLSEELEREPPAAGGVYMGICGGTVRLHSNLFPLVHFAFISYHRCSLGFSQKCYDGWCLYISCLEMEDSHEILMGFGS